MWAALSFGAGILTVSVADVGVETLLGVAVLLLAVATVLVLTGASSSWKGDVAFLLLAAACGALRFQMATRLLPHDHITASDLFGREVIATGRILEEPERRSEGMRFAMELERWQDPEGGEAGSVTGTVLVRLREMSPDLGYGDRLSLEARLMRPQPARNPGAFDYRRFLELKGIYGTMSARRPGQIVDIEKRTEATVYTELILNIRRGIRRSLQANIGGAQGGLLVGMLLGEKYRIPEEVRDRFRMTGLAHALVISGLHVGLVIVFFFTGFRLCRMPDRLASAATVLVLVLYAFVTELQPPVVRASIMAAVVLIGRIADRQGEVYNSLGLAALIILSLWPTDLLSLSFQLSFAATLSIVGLHGPIAQLFPASWRREDCWVGKWLISPLCVSIAAQIGTGPLIAYHFQQFAPISLVANLAVVPLLGLAVGLGLLAALTGWWLPLAATAFNASNYLVLTLLIQMVSAFAEVPWASVVVPKPGAPAMVVAAVLTILGAHFADSPRARRLFLYTALVAANAWVWTRVGEPRSLEVVFLDVGQGDGAFLQFPNGKTMIIDAGIRSRHFDNGARVVVPFLRHRNIDRVDVVVASHPHSDHIGGLVALLEQVDVGHFVDSGQVYDSWTARRLRQLIDERGITYHRVAAGDSLVGLGGVGALVLHPTEAFVDADGESPHDLNNGSVVIRFDHGDNSLLFTGDAERETDGAMVAWGQRLRTQVLKVAHHGSRTSSRPRFVEAVDPQIAMVSVGTRNKFRHPAPEVMERYRARGVAVYRTDHRGAITLVSDGKRLELHTMLEMVTSDGR